tara:strand:+ start:336 stop:623 length:288 start_codon:yes stop_codon:yes gene_type:complete
MIEPLGNRILVEAVEVKAIDTGIEGFVIPDAVTNNKDKPTKFKIINIGKGKDLEELNLSIGETIVMNRFAGSDVKDLDDKEYKIVLHGDIQGRIS